jgi:hypothetical protein
MSGKRLLTMSLLLPLLAASSVANAGPRITDKSYWPDGWKSSPSFEAYAMERGTAPLRFTRRPALAETAAGQHHRAHIRAARNRHW